MGLRTMIAAALSVALLASCGGGGDGNDSVGGPCIAMTEGPSLVIASATNAATGAAIPVVMLSDVVVNGVAVNATTQAMQPADAWVNVKATGGTLECTAACGFSNREGATTFTASAPGYASKAVSVQAAYSTRQGGCPSKSSNGASVAITLTPLS